MDKYLVTLEFRHNIVPEGIWGGECKSTKITLGVFEELKEACSEGNKALEVLESKFDLNPNYNIKERLSETGGCGGLGIKLISNLGYLITPFSFYLEITTLRYKPVGDSIDGVLEDIRMYKKYKTESY